jgi:3-phenylpropionate/cinnamic acid dioxygenase small subunit
MELLGKVAHVESRFGSFKDGVRVRVKWVHSLRQTYHTLRNYFGCTRWYSLVSGLKWKLVSFHMEIVLILTQDRCTVCAERSIGSKIISDAPDGTPR